AALARHGLAAFATDLLVEGAAAVACDGLAALAPRLGDAHAALGLLLLGHRRLLSPSAGRAPAAPARARRGLLLLDLLRQGDEFTHPLAALLADLAVELRPAFAQHGLPALASTDQAALATGLPHAHAAGFRLGRRARARRGPPGGSGRRPRALPGRRRSFARCHFNPLLPIEPRSGATRSLASLHARRSLLPCPCGWPDRCPPSPGFRSPRPPSAPRGRRRDRRQPSRARGHPPRAARGPRASRRARSRGRCRRPPGWSAALPAARAAPSRPPRGRRPRRAAYPAHRDRRRPAGRGTPPT